MSQSTDPQTAAAIASLSARIDAQAEARKSEGELMHRDITRIALVMERYVEMHDRRLVELEKFKERLVGVLVVLNFLGATTCAGIIYYLVAF